MQPQTQSPLAKLLALAQLSESINRPQLEQQQVDQHSRQAMLANALQMLGLQQQGQESQARLALEGRRVDNENAYHNSQAEHQQNQFQTALDKEDEHSLLNQFQGGQIPSDTILDMYRTNPRLAPKIDAIRQGQVQSNINHQNPLLAAVYGDKNNHNDPQKLQQALSTFHTTIPNEQVWNGLNWDQLNSSLPAAIPKHPSAFSDRQGGLLNFNEPGVIVPFLQQHGVIPQLPSPEERKSRWQQLMDAPDSPMSLLFGQKKQPQPLQ